MNLIKNIKNRYNYIQHFICYLIDFKGIDNYLKK
jgi:hypothetical protein